MGAQTLSPTRSSWARLVRTSSPTASPTRRTRSSFQVAPSPTACGKTVACPIQATPCRASWPVRKAASPSRSTAGANWCSIATRSSGVSRRSRSSTRSAKGSRGSRKGCGCSVTCGSFVKGGRYGGAGASCGPRSSLGRSFEALRCSTDDPAHVKGPPPVSAACTPSLHQGRRENRSEESVNGLLCGRDPSLNLAATSKRFDRASTDLRRGSLAPDPPGRRHRRTPPR